MRKFIKYKVLGLAFIVIGMVACDTASQEVEPVGSPDGYPVATVTNATGTSVVEGNTFTFNITTDKMIERSTTWAFRQTGGTATEEDYVAVEAVVAPYSKSAQLTITTFEDYDFDASETLVGEIGCYSIADRYLLNPSTVNPVAVNLTITNFVSPDLEVAFSWHADVVIDGETYDAADYIDFDFIVCPEAGFDINDPWATEIGIYDAATGSHPEHMTLDGLTDGSYLLVADLYYNDFVGASDGSVDIPIVTSFTRQGTSIIDTEVGMNPADMMADNTPGFDNDPSGAYNAVVAKVTLAAGKYTITKFDNSTIGPFKATGPRTPRPANYKTR